MPTKKKNKEKEVKPAEKTEVKKTKEAKKPKEKLNVVAQSVDQQSV